MFAALLIYCGMASVSPGENTGSSGDNVAMSVQCTGGSKSVFQGGSDGKDGWIGPAAKEDGRCGSYSFR